MTPALVTADTIPWVAVIGSILIGVILLYRTFFSKLKIRHVTEPLFLWMTSRNSCYQLQAETFDLLAQSEVNSCQQHHEINSGTSQTKIQGSSCGISCTRARKIAQFLRSNEPKCLEPGFVCLSNPMIFHTKHI